MRVAAIMSEEDPTCQGLLKLWRVGNLIAVVEELGEFGNELSPGDIDPKYFSSRPLYSNIDQGISQQ